MRNLVHIRKEVVKKKGDNIYWGEYIEMKNIECILERKESL
jgi:hypothetical protein